MSKRKSKKGFFKKIKDKLKKDPLIKLFKKK